MRNPLLVARGDPEDRDDLCLLRLGVDDVGAGTAAEPAGIFVVADEDPGMVLAIAVLDPDRVALLEPVRSVAHRWNPIPAGGTADPRPRSGGQGSRQGARP